MGKKSTASIMGAFRQTVKELEVHANEQHAEAKYQSQQLKHIKAKKAEAVAEKKAAVKATARLKKLVG